MYEICIVCELDVVETENSFHVVGGSAKILSRADGFECCASI